MPVRITLVVLLTTSLLALVPALALAATDARSSSQAEAVLVDLVNDRRAEVGAPPLTPRADLHAISRDWSFAQAERGDLAHNPNLSSQACCWTRIAENVARDSDHDGSGATAIARGLMDLWRRSSGHDAAMTDRDVDQVGVGVVIDDDGTAWGTTVFRACDGTDCAGGAQRPAGDTSRSWGPPPAPEPVPDPEPEPASEPEPQPEPEPEPGPAPDPLPSPSPSPSPPPRPSPAPTPAPSPSPNPGPSPRPLATPSRELPITRLAAADAAAPNSVVVPQQAAVPLLGAVLGFGIPAVLRRRRR